MKISQNSIYALFARSPSIANCDWTKKKTKPKFQLGRFLWKAWVTMKTVNTPVHHNFITSYLIIVCPEYPWFCPQSQGKCVSKSMNYPKFPGGACPQTPLGIHVACQRHARVGLSPNTRLLLLDSHLLKSLATSLSRAINISLNSFIPDSFLPSGHTRVENNYCYVEVPLLHNNWFFLD